MKIKLLSCLLIFLMALPLMAAPPRGKSVGPISLTTDNVQYINVNNILMFVTNGGNYGRDLADVFGNDYGTYYPYTSVAAIENGSNITSPYYAGGIWLGGIDSATSEERVTVSIYSYEYAPGPMEGGTFLPDDPAFHVYHLYSDSLVGTPNGPNDDYRNWPIDQGAPYETDSLGDPITDDSGYVIPALVGNQMMWSVFNDANPATHTNSAGETAPMGIEIRQTAFAFNREDPLGNIVFLKFQIFNKGDNVMNNFYISLWSDPDLGGSGDDYVGCDTSLDLGFVYNATNDDQYYGSTPPSLGIDFFQGPLIETGDMADTARMWGDTIPGYVNMGMTSFNKYINGTDPNDHGEAYNYMQGLQASGSPQINNETGEATKFVLTGDPVKGTGDLDLAASDRRWMQTTGPITFRPGDSTEILAAIVVGRGGDRLSSISVMKYYDQFAQSAYDINFNIAEPPASPIVTTSHRPGQLTLMWTDTSEVVPGDYPFQGYSVFQGESSSGPWSLIANYDVIDGVAQIQDFVLDPLTGALEQKLVRNGTDGGIQRYMVITQDYLLGGKLNDYTTYYYRVEAYSYEPTATPVTQYSANTDPIEVTPEAQRAGLETPVAALDTIEVTHTSGGGSASNGFVYPLVVDPYSLTGDDYRVDFGYDTVLTFNDAYYSYTWEVDTTTDTCDAYWDADSGRIEIVYCIDSTITDSTFHAAATDTAISTFWNWVNLTTGDTLAARNFNQSGDEDYPIADGIQLKVLGPEYGVVAIDEVAGAGGTAIDPPDNVMYSLNSTGDWYISSDQGSNFARMNWQGLIGTSDWEFRFTATGSEYYDWLTDDKWPTNAPFEVWNIGIGTPEDASDDHQIFFSIIDDDESGGWSYGDRIYPWEVDYFSPAPANAYDASLYAFPADFHIGRIQINDYSEATTQPAEGTVIRFTTAKVNTSADVFTFSSEAPSYTQSEKLLDKIKTVPNPFYLYGPYDPSPGSYQIKFTHLPAKCSISIYNLGGDFIRKIEHNDPASSEESWDILTENGLPVASGIYLWVVDAPGFGQKIGKMAVFTEAEVLKIY